MSFMSFDYAIRASDAALQMQQGMAQNLRDTNQRVSDVGKRNATSKDQLVRQKIQAEYDMTSANVKAWKAGRLHSLAEERAKTAKAAAAIVGIGTLVGGMVDGICDLKKHFQNDQAKVPQAPESEQMTVDGNAGLVSAFPIAASQPQRGGQTGAVAPGPTEQGAVVAFDSKKGSFGAFGVDRTTGGVTKFSNMSMTEMATLVREKTAGSSELGAEALFNMTTEGPPIAFKPGMITQKEDGSFAMSPELQAALFGGGPKADGSRQDGFFASEKGSAAIAGVVDRGAAISPGYQATSRSVMGLLENPKIQDGLGIKPATVDKTRAGFEKSGLLTGGVLSGAGEIFKKAIFKPLSTSLSQFMNMAKVAKEYDEEAKAKQVEYAAAKQQAAAAMKRLKQIEAQLAAGV
ncbi:MAG: hypothetical protein AB7I41_13360 [Candidatus Sericytochromatia bacterium]